MQPWKMQFQERSLQECVCWLFEDRKRLASTERAAYILVARGKSSAFVASGHAGAEGSVLHYDSHSAGADNVTASLSRMASTAEQMLMALQPLYEVTDKSHLYCLSATCIAPAVCGKDGRGICDALEASSALEHWRQPRPVEDAVHANTVSDCEPEILPPPQKGWFQRKRENTSSEQESPQRKRLLRPAEPNIALDTPSPKPCMPRLETPEGKSALARKLFHGQAVQEADANADKEDKRQAKRTAKEGSEMVRLLGIDFHRDFQPAHCSVGLGPKHWINFKAALGAAKLEEIEPSSCRLPCEVCQTLFNKFVFERELKLQNEETEEGKLSGMENPKTSTIRKRIRFLQSQDAASHLPIICLSFASYLPHVWIL